MKKTTKIERKNYKSEIQIEQNTTESIVTEICTLCLGGVGMIGLVKIYDIVKEICKEG